MVRLAVWNVFLLLALEFRFTTCIPDNQSSVSPHPTDGVSVTDAMATVSLTASTSGPRLDHTSKTPPAETQRRSANSTEPPSENKTPLHTSSIAIHTRPHSDPPADNSSTRAPSTYDARRNTTMSIIYDRPPSAPPTPESSKTVPSSPNDTTRTYAQSTISTRLPNDSYSTPAVRIPGGSSAGPGPVTNQPCPTSTSTGWTGPANCAPGQAGRAGQCLLAVAVLASLLTVFMVSTAVLCSKLSSRKYSFVERGHETGTEMVCISAIMPERSVSFGGRRTLLAGVDDSDEDGGDNLTLNSFLPNGDYMV